MPIRTGLRALVAVEPVELELGQPPLARDPVHDLELLRQPGDRAEQPVAPCARLVVVARPHERQQCQRRVAEPAVPVVPVPNASERLGQRRRRRGDDAARRRVGERLERDERAHERLAEAAGVRADPSPTPARSPRCRSSACSASTRSGGGLFDGYHVRTNGTRSPASDVELGDGVEVAADELDRRREEERVGPRDGEQALRRAAAPTGRSSRSRAGSLRLIRIGDGSLDALDDAHDVRRAPARRHEVDQRGRCRPRTSSSVSRIERVVSVAAPGST